jgi:glycosyltransferase 2 family protein
MIHSRWFRLGASLTVTLLAGLYILSKIDVRKTLDIIGSASLGWLSLSIFLMFVTVIPMTWRWQKLLAARGIHDTYRWLTRAYFVSYAVGQVLPTSVGGDASRIYETGRRHPGQLSPITGSVLLERALGGAITLLLAAIGMVLAIGEYDIGPYLWIEILFVVLTIFAGIVFFSRTVRRWLRPFVPLARRLRIERPARAVYEGIHGYRYHVSTLLLVCGATLIVQLGRIVAIWASGKSVGIDLPLRPYIVLGPLLFLVMLVPFTINGFAVREAFFVSFLGKLGVDADSAFACGFLFFVMTLVLALPGFCIILWESLRRRAPVVDTDG